MNHKLSTHGETIMRSITQSSRVSRLYTLFAALLVIPISGLADDKADVIKEALSAAWPGMTEGATVVDWEGNVLKDGTNGYTCMPSPPDLTGP